MSGGIGDPQTRARARQLVVITPVIGAVAIAMFAWALVAPRDVPWLFWVLGAVLAVIAGASIMLQVLSRRRRRRDRG